MEGHAHGHDDGFGVHALLWMRQRFCGIQGHDNLMHFERERVFLKCVSCGHESPGWELTEAPPTVRMEGDAQRHVLTPPRLADVRRVA
jgi:hypothetical protein